MTIEERYAQLQQEPTYLLEVWSHFHYPDRAALIVAILKNEYNASTFNTWADIHSVPRIS
jgi:hypothetical protein